MAKFNVKETYPERYERVKKEQKELESICESQLRLARLCPYCHHKISVVIRGEHSYTSEKCPNCGEDVVFPPISFRMSS